MGESITDKLALLRTRETELEFELEAVRRQSALLAGDAFGKAGIRDPENPCFEFEPGDEVSSWADCETDGHYICKECIHNVHRTHLNPEFKAMTDQSNVYEITNPSDPYTIQGDPNVCAIAVMVLGDGAFGVKDRDGKTVLPILMFGGEDAFGRWLTKAGLGGIGNLGDWIKGHRDELVAALDTILIGSFGDRIEVEAALASMTAEEGARYLGIRHETKRSSLNDIGRSAKAWAAKLRALDVVTQSAEV